MKSPFAATVFNRKEINTYIILLSAPVLLTIYRYHGTAGQFGRYFPGMQASPLADFYGVLWQFLAFFILTFLLPVLFVKTRLQRPLADIGAFEQRQECIPDAGIDQRFVQPVVRFLR